MFSKAGASAVVAWAASLALAAACSADSAAGVDANGDQDAAAQPAADTRRDEPIEGVEEVPGHPYVVAGQGTCVGSGWCWRLPLPQGHGLRAVRAVADDDIWIVGDSGTRLHWDGAQWQAWFDERVDLRALWVAPSGTVWAVGGRSAVYTEANAEAKVMVGDAVAGFSLVELDASTGPPAGIWGSSEHDVWLVSPSGQGAHYDGQAWVPWAQSEALTAIDGRAADDIWAVGNPSNSRHVVLHYDGGGWTEVALQGTGATWRLLEVWVAGEDDVWVSGVELTPGVGPNGKGVLARLSGGEWTLFANGSVDGLVASALGGLWGDGAGTVWAAGQGMGVKVDVAAGTATPFFKASFQTLEDLDGVAPGRLLAVGSQGAITFSDGVVWTSNVERSAGAGDGFAAVGAAGPNDLWAVAAEGRLSHWDGLGWKVVESGAPQLERLFVAGPEAAWATAVTGVIRWDGAAWSPVAGLPIQRALDVWGSGPADVWVAGERAGFGDGAAWRFDGSGWALGFGTSDEDPDTEDPVIQAVGGSSPQDVWFAGTQGYTLHLAAGDRSEHAVPGAPSLTAVDSGAGDEAWAAGDGRLFRWTAGAWSEVSTPAPVQHLVASAAGVWIASGRTLWRRDGEGWRDEGLHLPADQRITDLYEEPDGGAIWLSASGAVLMRKSLL